MPMLQTIYPRCSGLLLHPTALPGKQGIGTLGREAYAFIDFLADSGQKLWQICPLGPTGYGDSPYQCFSAFAGNPLLIDLDSLAAESLLTSSEIESLKTPQNAPVDFGRLIPSKTALLRKAFGLFDRKDGRFSFFRGQNDAWLETFGLFMALKLRYGGRSWEHWDRPVRFRDPRTITTIAAELKEEILFQNFCQFKFFEQWEALHAYAGERGIKIIGDMPIFIAYDSAETWAHPERFLLDGDLRPSIVAGVPPDYFCDTGQLWGNPIYNWDFMKEHGFSWWLTVLRSKLKLFDYIRIDHFRGFASYWGVPYGELTAKNGSWIKAPGKELFTKVKKELGDVPILAEDLGYITPEVEELLAFCGYPGMKILQFAFDSREKNEHLPHTYSRNSVVYTGTHDNDTCVGWYKSASDKDRTFAREYLNAGGEINWDFIRAALASVAVMAIIPLQDLLGLGTDARFNTPGTAGGNWTWRMPTSALDESLAARLRKITELYGR